MKRLFIIALVILFASASSCEKKIERPQPPVVVNPSDTLPGGNDNPPTPGKDTLAIGQFNPAADTYSIREEFRAAWVSTAWQTDWPLSTRSAYDYNPNNLKVESASSYEGDLRELIATIHEAGCNVVIFQSVSFMDAMYESSILPWSRYLTGSEGGKPSFDPLKVAIEECRARDMEIHVWMNPYRVGSTSRVFSASHPMKKHPEWLMNYKSNYYWNPGIPAVHEFLASVVSEVCTRYDIDGVHIDDYFYPSGFKADSGNASYDRNQYNQYGGGKSLDEWRFSNVDATVRAMFDAVHAARPSAVFGVSPSGRLVNTQALYADPTRWKDSSGKWYIDYLAPQIYWQNDHSVADARFGKNVIEWPTKNVPGVPVMPGIGIYRYDPSTFNYDEYLLQMRQCRAQEGIYGQFWYSSRDIVKHLDFLKSQVYPAASLVPKIGSFDGAVPAKPVVTVTVAGTAAKSGTLSWEADAKASGYAVYELVETATKCDTITKATGKAFEANMIAKGDITSQVVPTGRNYVVVAYNRDEHSPASDVVFVK